MGLVKRANKRTLIILWLLTGVDKVGFSLFCFRHFEFVLLGISFRLWYFVTEYHYYQKYCISTPATLVDCLAMPLSPDHILIASFLVLPRHCCIKKWILISSHQPVMKSSKQNRKPAEWKWSLDIHLHYFRTILNCESLLKCNWLSTALRAKMTSVSERFKYDMLITKTLRNKDFVIATDNKTDLYSLGGDFMILRDGQF